MKDPNDSLADAKAEFDEQHPEVPVGSKVINDVFQSGWWAGRDAAAHERKELLEKAFDAERRRLAIGIVMEVAIKLLPGGYGESMNRVIHDAVQVADETMAALERKEEVKS